MRIIIAGSRDITDLAVIERGMQEVKDKHFGGVWSHGLTILSGGARGVDQLGERWANIHNARIELYPAEWDKHGRSAGYIRNIEMAKRAGMLVAFWDQESRGTKHMIGVAVEHNLIVEIITLTPKEKLKAES